MSEVDSIRQEYPTLPESYFTYLLDHGSGQTPSGRTIYGGPIPPQDIYPSFEGEQIVLLGDDFQGYCLGFDQFRRQFGEIDPRGDWQPFTEPFHFPDYVTDSP